MGPDTENDHTSGSRDAKPKVGTGHVFEVGYVPHERDAAQADAAQADATGDAGREETKASAGTPPFPGASAGRSAGPSPDRRHREAEFARREIQASVCAPGRRASPG